MTPFFETAQAALRGGLGGGAHRRGRRFHRAGTLTRSILLRARSFVGARENRLLTLSAGSIGCRSCAPSVYAAFLGLDALMVPTMPRPVTVSEVEADPIGPNSQLGTYTNFVNLLDLAGIAVPGVAGKRWHPFRCDSAGSRGPRRCARQPRHAAMHARSGLTLGALGARHRPRMPTLASGLRSGEIAIAVVGAHMSGMAAQSRAARPMVPALLESDVHRARLPAVRTRRHALQARPVARCCRSGKEHRAWRPGRCPRKASARSSRRCLAPLSIGTIRLHDGSSVKGFLVEAAGYCAASRDISEFRRMARLSRSGRARVAGIGVVDRADMARA